MKTFEYKHFCPNRFKDIIPGLNALGKQGWDVVCREASDINTSGYAYLLRRDGEGAPVEIRNDINVPSRFLSIVPANGDAPPVDAHAAAAERTTHRLVPRDPPDTRIPWAEAKPSASYLEFQPSTGNYLIDGQKVTRETARYFEHHGHLPADKVQATAH